MTDDDAIADRLLLPPCRPTLMWGIPYAAFWWLWSVWGVSLVMFGAAVTGTGVCISAGWGLYALTAHDFNAVSVILTYSRTKLVATRSTIWPFSVTLDPLFPPLERR